MSKFSKAVFSVFIFVLLGTLSPYSASAQDIVWSNPAKISTSSNHAILPATVTGPNGYLHAVWAEWNPADPINYWTGIVNPGIFYSYWNGDAWSSPIKISENTSFAAFPSIAVTDNNVVHVVWEDDSPSPSGSYGRILYRSSANYGASWTSITSATESLDTQTGAWAWYPKIVKDSLNNLHLIFLYYNDIDPVFGTAYYSKWSGSWSTPERASSLPGVQQVNDVSIAVGPDNNPQIIMEEDFSVGGQGDYTGIWYAYKNVSWQTPVQLSANDLAGWPRIVVDNNNYPHVIWTQPNGTGKEDVSYNKNTGSGWNYLTTISSQVDRSNWFYPIVGITYDSANNIYVGWGERLGNWPGEPERGVQISYKRWSSATSQWDVSPTFMHYAYDTDAPFVYKDKWDNQHYAWIEQDSETKQWTFWFSTIPINIRTYNPDSILSLTIANTLGDTLSIPANATTSSTNISVQVGPLPASADPGYTTIPRSYTFRPHGLQFAANKAATAVIYYSDAEIIGADEKNLKVYIWNGQTNAWDTSFSTNVNRTLNRATITLPHFSLYGFMAPIAEKKVNITWKPPISNTELYSAPDGSTLPIKFSLTYEDGTPVTVPNVAGDVGVLVGLVSETDDSWSKEYFYGTGTDNVRYDSGSNQYIFNLHTKELNLSTGKYFVKVYHQGYFWGSKYFQLTQTGKVKGEATP